MQSSERTSRGVSKRLDNQALAEMRLTGSDIRILFDFLAILTFNSVSALLLLCGFRETVSRTQ
jgi:hypothetical protein